MDQNSKKISAWITQFRNAPRARTFLKPIHAAVVVTIGLTISGCDTSDAPSNSALENPTTETSIKEQFNVCVEASQSFNEQRTKSTIDTGLLANAGMQKCLAQALKSCKSALNALECQTAVQAINQHL